jgi:glutamate-1-semialdehyde 2,1-aminomutase
LVDGLADQAGRHGMAMLPPGPAAMPVIRFADDPDRALTHRWCGRVTAAGAYAHPTHNWFVSAAHSEDDVARTLEATEAAFRALAAER